MHLGRRLILGINNGPSWSLRRNKCDIRIFQLCWFAVVGRANAGEPDGARHQNPVGSVTYLNRSNRSSDLDLRSFRYDTLRRHSIYSLSLSSVHFVIHWDKLAEEQQITEPISFQHHILARRRVHPVGKPFSLTAVYRLASVHHLLANGGRNNLDRLVERRAFLEENAFEKLAHVTVVFG